MSMGPNLGVGLAMGTAAAICGERPIARILTFRSDHGKAVIRNIGSDDFASGSRTAPCSNSLGARRPR